MQPANLGVVGLYCKVDTTPQGGIKIFNSSTSTTLLELRSAEEILQLVKMLTKGYTHIATETDKVAKEVLGAFAEAQKATEDAESTNTRFRQIANDENKPQNVQKA